MASSLYAKHILFLTKTGCVYGLGDNNFYQLGPKTRNITKPMKVYNIKFKSVGNQCKMPDKYCDILVRTQV